MNPGPPRGFLLAGPCRWSAVRCGGVRCGAVECGAVRWSAVRCGGVRWSAVRCGGVRWSAHAHLHVGKKKSPPVKGGTNQGSWSTGTTFPVTTPYVESPTA